MNSYNLYAVKVLYDLIGLFSGLEAAANVVDKLPRMASQRYVALRSASGCYSSLPSVCLSVYGDELHSDL